MTGGREHQGSSCRGVGVVRLEPFDPSSGSGRGLLAESSNAEDVRPNGPPPGRARVTVGAGCKCLGRDGKCLEASRREK